MRSVLCWPAPQQPSSTVRHALWNYPSTAGSLREFRAFGSPIESPYKQHAARRFWPDRPLAMATLGDDVAAVIEALVLRGGRSGRPLLRSRCRVAPAIQHPTKIRRLVVISTAYARRGWYPEVQEGMAAVSAAMAATTMQTPMGQFSRTWPEPDRFPKFLDKMGKMMSEDYDWSVEIRRFTMPVLIVFTDHDSVSQQHVAEFFALLGGGISEPGWQSTKFTNARLAIVPGYSHYNFISSKELPPIVDRYLTSSLEGTREDAAAASAVASIRE